jgi:hypothetical protein
MDYTYITIIDNLMISYHYHSLSISNWCSISITAAQQELGDVTKANSISVKQLGQLVNAVGLRTPQDGWGSGNEPWRMARTRVGNLYVSVVLNS